jgi:hypothetical protein
MKIATFMVVYKEYMLFMKKPVYRYPEFVITVFIKKTTEKRYWLHLKIDSEKKDTIVVLLKNPSRADQNISDKTVFNVCNYIYRNREKYEVLKNIGNILILNLIPHYCTDSADLKSLQESIVDSENLKYIHDFSKKYKNIIIAWGNAPSGLQNKYKDLANTVMEILANNQNCLYYVDKLSALGNPKHGQVWSYKDALRSFS